MIRCNICNEYSTQYVLMYKRLYTLENFKFCKNCVIENFDDIFIKNMKENFHSLHCIYCGIDEDMARENDFAGYYEFITNSFCYENQISQYIICIACYDTNINFRLKNNL